MSSFIHNKSYNFIATDLTPTSSQKVRIFSVSELIDEINNSVKHLRVVVQGEIGKVDIRGKAVYFTLLDKKQSAMLNCIVWTDKLLSFGIDLEAGLEVKILGAPDIYKPNGKLSFKAENISLIGEGALKLAFDRLQLQLKQEGYFDVDRKRAIPQYPTNIGLITSEFGDARTDFITHIGSFGYKIYFYDVRVEGVNAIDNIVEAIKWFNENTKNIDVLVLTRGGGGLESLQAFNNKDIAKAIYSSRIPIITGIGHENDVTIADLVADLRASTPTHAGKIISQYWSEAINRVETTDRNIVTIFRNKCDSFKELISYHEIALISKYQTLLNNYTQMLIESDRFLINNFRSILEKIKVIENNFSHNFHLFAKQIGIITYEVGRYEEGLLIYPNKWLNDIKVRLNSMEDTLIISDPELKLKQGYSIAKDSTGSIIKSADSLKIGESLTIKLYKGVIDSTVEKITE